MKNKAIFLDRDGTLNFDPGYLDHPDKLVLLDHVPEALSLFKKHNYKLIIISNQSGISRGLITEANLKLINEKINFLLSPHNVSIDAFYLCTHHPDEKCGCRKPSPKLLLKAQEDLNLDLNSSYMIGDRASDLIAGQKAKCKGSILLLTGDGSKTASNLDKINPSFIAKNLLTAAQWIIKNEGVTL